MLFLGIDIRFQHLLSMRNRYFCEKLKEHSTVLGPSECAYLIWPHRDYLFWPHSASGIGGVRVN